MESAWRKLLSNEIEQTHGQERKMDEKDEEVVATVRRIPVCDACTIIIPM